MGGLMAIYRAKRWKVQYPVQLFIDNLLVEGWTVDMSLQGLRVATQSSIREGTHVIVRVLEPDCGSTVDCMLYTVRWINSGRIGLEASEISATEQRRLQDWLASVDEYQEPAIESANPCMTIEQPITSITGTVAVLWHLLFPRRQGSSTSNGSLHFLQGAKQ
jgi:hypothetical protein